MTKSATYAYRGKELERALNKLSAHYEAQNIHMHKNNPSRTFDGTYISGEPFDYEVLYKGVMYAFDAKECEGPAWPISQVKIKQMKHLLNLSEHGAEAFFMIYFSSIKKLMRIDVETVKDLMANDVKTITPEMCTLIRLDFLGVLQNKKAGKEE